MRTLSIQLLSILLFCILFASIVIAIQSGTIVHFDSPIISFVQGMENPWLTSVMKSFTWIGSEKGAALISLIIVFILFFFLRRWQDAFFLMFVMVATIALNGVLKYYFKRARPEIHRILDAGGFSFPSGHTMIACSLYVIIAYIGWRIIKTAWSRVLLVCFTIFMIFSIGISRVYLGVHYPSDIVGGIVTSGIWVIISIMVYTFIQKQLKKRPT